MFRWLAVWALCLCATSAWAQPADLSDAATAYRAGEKAMAAGRFEDAVRSYGAAYEISKDPVLFFKLGSALDKAGKCSPAITYYQRYLREAKPSESFEKLTRSRIAACEAKVATEAPTAGPTTPKTTPEAAAEATTEAALKTTPPPQPPDPAPTAAEPPASEAIEPPASDEASQARPQEAPVEAPYTGPSARRTGAWFGVATSLALVTVGSVFALSIESTEDDLRDLYVIRAGGRPLVYEGAGRDRYEDLVERGEQYRTLAWVSFGLAGAAALTSTVLFLTSDAETTAPRAAVAPLLDEHGAGIAASLRF